MAKRVFTPEFKREAVRLANKPGISKAQASRDLGIHPNVLKAWCAKFKSGKWEEAPGSELKSAQAKEFEKMKRELDRVTMERDILKKALAYFAKESK
jgi:transposase